MFSVARILNPSSANAFATSTTSSLSLRFTEISTVPPNGSFDIIVNSPVGKESVNDDSYLRKGAIKAKIPYYTTIAAAKAAAEGIAYVKAHQDQNEEVNSLQGLHAQISDKF